MLGRHAVLLPHRHGRTDCVTDRVADGVTNHVANHVANHFTDHVTDRVPHYESHDEPNFFTERVADKSTNGGNSLGYASADGKM